jgi:hypothetical protein
MSKNIMGLAKPLKGSSLNLDSANIGKLRLDQLDIPLGSLQYLMSGLNLDNVLITNSQIENTIIGKNVSNEANFTKLITTSDVIMYNLDKSNFVSWDATNSIFSIDASFSVIGCATIGNIQICQNTISAINNNGNINIIPNGLGTIFLTGPVQNVVNSQGNYLTSLANGNINFLSSDYILFNSSYGFYQLDTFSDQILTTTNGDITLNTEYNLTPKAINMIQNSGGTAVSTITNSNIRNGDKITITGTNSNPNMDGIYTVTNVLNKNTFLISTGNTFTGLLSNSTTGTILKTASNNINLNAAVHVKIPSNIDLTFGNTTNNIYGNTGGLFITSLQNVNFNVPGKIQIPQNVNFQLGTSSNTNMNFNGTSLNINSTGGTIALTSSTGLLNIPSLFITDQNPLLANYTQSSSDLTDKGIQFKYWDSTNGSSLGWIGYKQSTGKFTFLTSATNSNDVITGISSAFDIGSINVTNITLNPNGIINANCGQITNISLITGCGGTVNINGSSNVNISTGTRLALISGGDIFIPNNIPIVLGTAGSSIKEGTLGNLFLTSSRNVFINTQTNGSIVIPINTVLSFDGTTIGNQNISSNSNGNLILNSNKNIFLTTTGGNIILPASTFNTSSSLQFGDTSNTIYGGTNGIYINSVNNSFGSINFIASTNVNITSSTGNFVLNSLNGDINLLSSQGNVRVYQGSRIIFGISNTSNSIRSNTIGNLIINGSGNSIGNISLQNTSQINLTATTSVNIPSSVQVNLSGNNDKYIITNTNGNFNINNIASNGNIILTSFNTSLINTSGTTTIINNITNISSSNFTLTGSIGNLNSGDLYLAAQNPVLANYIQTNTDITDRGILYNYYSTNVSSAALGWFGVKKDTQQFTFYQTAINNNDVITGTLGSIALGNLNVNNNITFLSTGNLNMACGTISNLNTILGCNGTININGSSNVNVSATNIMLSSNSSGTIGLPFNTPLSFGNTTNSIIVTSNGNMIINANGGNGTIILNSNVQINGTTDSIYSTVTNYQDPILSIGGVTVPITNDLKDRGIEFKWNTGSITQTGFFGFQNSTQRFVFYSQDTNTNEIISGSFGNVQFANGYYNNLDVNCGTISNLSLLTACNNTGLTISSSSGINLSTNNILVSNGGKLNFGNTNNNISSTNGILNITSQFNTNITSQSGGIIFNTNTNGSGYTQFSINSPMYFGQTSSNNFLIRNTQGDFIIENSTGNIYLNPTTNTANSTGGLVVIPSNNTLAFNNTSTSISGDGNVLTINGYSVNINSTGPITLNGDVNIIGGISALSTNVSNDVYILPLGTEEILTATNIVNGNSGFINITTSSVHYLRVGDSISIKNSDTTPAIDGNYIVSNIISPTVFSIAHASISSPGIIASITGVLVTYQGKDIGLEFDFWNNTTGNGITSGSQYYVRGGLVRQSTTGNLAFYSNATISNNVVTTGILGDMQLNKLFTNKISGFTLDGPIVGGTFIIGGSNFQIGGGNIDNTPIGQTTAQNGRFTNLSSTISTNLQNTTLQGTFNYSIERYTLSSLLQTRNPSTNTIISYVSVNGATFIGTGTMGNSSINDGNVKKISISSMGANCQYQLAFASGKLITPNPLNGPLPTKMTFKRAGQSCEIMWDATLSAWILQSGNVYIS